MVGRREDHTMNERIEKLLELVQVNEQIERLAKQAGCTIDRMGYGEGNLEMFAELIVLECLEMMGTNISGTFDSDWDFDTQVKYVKKYFGIKR
jgi:hypothetical protein